MRKVFALVIGLLVLGGMMGIVNAFTPDEPNGQPDGDPTNWINIEGPSSDSDKWYTPTDLAGMGYSPANEYIEIDIDDSDIGTYSDLYDFHVSADSDYIYFLIHLEDLSTAGTRVLIALDDGADFQGTFSAIYDTSFNNPGEIIWFQDTDGSSYSVDAYILINTANGYYAVYHATPTGWAVDYLGSSDIATSGESDCIELRIPRSYVTSPLLGIAVATYSSIDDTYDVASKSSNVIYKSNFYTIDISQVPFFSNAGIAAVILLLVIGAVWFFRRQ